MRQNLSRANVATVPASSRREGLAKWHNLEVNNTEKNVPNLFSHILNQQESQHTEWKEAWRYEYLPWVCGFASWHSAAGGWMTKRWLRAMPN